MISFKRFINEDTPDDLIGMYQKNPGIIVSPFYMIETLRVSKRYFTNRPKDAPTFAEAMRRYNMNPSDPLLCIYSVRTSPTSLTWSIRCNGRDTGLTATSKPNFLSGMLTHIDMLRTFEYFPDPEIYPGDDSIMYNCMNDTDGPQGRWMINPAGTELDCTTFGCEVYKGLRPPLSTCISMYADGSPTIADAKKVIELSPDVRWPKFGLYVEIEHQGLKYLDLSTGESKPAVRIAHQTPDLPGISATEGKLFGLSRAIALCEGGNVRLHYKGKEISPDSVDLKKVDREDVANGISSGFEEMDEAFEKDTGKSAWDGKLTVNPADYFLGSARYFFDPNTPTEQLSKYKSSFNDFDVLVAGDSFDELFKFLVRSIGRSFGMVKVLGVLQHEQERDAPGLQINCIFEYLGGQPFKFQTDFVRGKHSSGERPKEFDVFARSSDFDDIKAGVKGVFHKYLLQSMVKSASSIPKGDFKVITPSSYKKYKEMRIRDDAGLRNFTSDPKAFKVSKSKKYDRDISAKAFSIQYGVRNKYQPVKRFDGRQLEHDGLPVYLEIKPDDPTTDIVSDLSGIFREIFGRKPEKGETDQMWNFVGLLQMMKKEFDKNRRAEVFYDFLSRLFGDPEGNGPEAQGLSRDSKEDDRKAKFAAVERFVKEIPELAATWRSSKMKKAVEDYYAGYDAAQAKRAAPRVNKGEKKTEENKDDKV